MIYRAIIELDTDAWDEDGLESWLNDNLLGAAQEDGIVLDVLGVYPEPAE